MPDVARGSSRALRHGPANGIGVNHVIDKVPSPTMRIGWPARVGGRSAGGR